ncbi:MAG TPA: HIT family protein [Candidatus Binatia bacterium]|nr:HIT family protein [Candidatus Binatia bacterium]
MTDCIFCKILAQQIPSHKIYEDDRTYAFLSIQPVNPGHALVIHKHHHADIFDTPEQDLKDLIVAAKHVATKIKNVLKPDGINIGMNNEAAAGQVIFHAHLHVIPRLSNDGFKHWPHKDAKPEELKAIADKLR